MKIQNPFNFARKNASWAITLVLILTAFGSNAQSESDNSGIMMFIVSMVALVSVLVLMVAIYALQVIKKLETNQPAKTEDEPSLWKLFLKVANNRADEEEEADILMDHNYDGIRELDNHLPPWWKWLFYITIIWGVIYVVGHHYTDWFPLQEEEYEIAMASANAEKDARQAANTEAGGFDEASLVYSDDADVIAAGQKIYARKACNSCHGNVGEGNTIGPNLTDNYWLHGGSIQDVYTTIKNGVPDKGMISWESQLTPAEIRDVSTYVLSLVGSNPPGGKAAQGKLYEEGAENTTDEVTEEAPEEVEEAVAVSEGDEPAGKSIFDSTCAACHTTDGGGVVGLGPNLTDKYWKNSNGSRDGIIKTITDGVAGTSMMAWSASLDKAQIEAVTDYVLAMQGTTPANPKEPEGDLYE